MGKQTVKVLFYAINGLGLGHLARLLAIAREGRDLLAAAGLVADFQFVTTSEAPHVAGEFPVFKIPAKGVFSGAPKGVRGAYAAAAKLMVSNLAAAFRPEVLVVDTVPEGAFREVLFLRDYARLSVFIDRHKDRRRSASALHQSHLALYDRILVPDAGDAAARYPLPPRLEARRRFVGRVHGFRPETAWPRARVREHFGAAPGQRLVYLSAGGGGDPAAAAELDAITRALADDPSLLLLLGYGPLFAGQRTYRGNVIPLSEPDVSRYFGGLDLAVCAAGYNTYEELLAAGVPALFYAQKKGLDRQDERIAHGLGQGWHGELAGLDPALVRGRVHGWLEGGEAAETAARLRGRPPQEGALRAAEEILRAHADLPGSPLGRPALSQLAALRSIWRREPAGSFAEVARTTTDWTALKVPAEEAEAFVHHARGEGGHPGEEWCARARARLAAAAELEGLRMKLVLGRDGFRKLLRGYGEPGTDHASLARRLGDALEALLGSLGAADARSALDLVLGGVRRHDVPAALDGLIDALQARPGESREVLDAAAGDGGLVDRDTFIQRLTPAANPPQKTH